MRVNSKELDARKLFIEELKSLNVKYDAEDLAPYKDRDFMVKVHYSGLRSDWISKMMKKAQEILRKGPVEEPIKLNRLTTMEPIENDAGVEAYLFRSKKYRAAVIVSRGENGEVKLSYLEYRSGQFLDDKGNIWSWVNGREIS